MIPPLAEDQDFWTEHENVGCPVCGLEACEDHLPADIAQDTCTGNLPPNPQEDGGLVGLSFDDLRTHVFPERKPLLVRGETPVFREGHLGEIYAARGFGKTWFLKTLALIAASGGHALGFHAPTPCRVLDIDGEMASQDIKDRYELLAGHLGISSAPSLQIVAADWQDKFIPRLDTPQGQAALEPFIEQADLIFLDNRSCLFDPEGESDPGAWQPAQDWLLSLRRRGKAVMLAHHSNRQGGARGHSKPEDPMNLLINLTHPEGYSQEHGARFVVTFEKSRGAYGAAVAPFIAQLGAEGWKTEGVNQQATGQQAAAGKLIEYVRLADGAGERVKSANDAITKAKVNRNVALKAWGLLREQGTILQHPEGGFYVR